MDDVLTKSVTSNFCTAFSARIPYRNYPQ